MSDLEDKKRHKRDDTNVDGVDADVPTAKRTNVVVDSYLLDRLPNTDLYEKSYMHRDTVLDCRVTPTDFIITTSNDGIVKFWKKVKGGIEFVKTIKAHTESIVCMDVSPDGVVLATISTDKALSIFDIVNFDLINIIELPFIPDKCCLLSRDGKMQVVVTDQTSFNFYFYDIQGDQNPVSKVSISAHQSRISCVAYNPTHDTMISIDEKGMIEYWNPENGLQSDRVAWKFKSDTDLYELAKNRTTSSHISFSPNFSLFALMCTDNMIRLFRFATGKLFRVYDETITAITALHQEKKATVVLDNVEFGRRLAVEKELIRMKESSNAVFDESGQFLLYPSLYGIKVIHLKANRVVKILGREENAVRFLRISLYQGVPGKKKIVSIEAAASENSALVQALHGIEPLVVCTGFKKARFYLFTRQEPPSVHVSEGNEVSRDVFNEKPTKEDMISTVLETKKDNLAHGATIHTSLGDIHMELYPEAAPKAVENFVVHSREGYFNGVIFHRVIKGFMLQTGDPLGDGTGGESIWGREFEDEFHSTLKHDRPHVVSMANCGPNTNGSQFFITTAPTPWLDNKHTIFGKCTTGLDVIRTIEHLKTDKTDKPLTEVKIINISLDSK